MMRTTRLLALALVAAFAVTAPAATGAQPTSSGGGDATATAAAKKAKKKKRCRKGYKRTKKGCRRVRRKPRVNLAPRNYKATRGLSPARFTKVVTDVIELPASDGTNLYLEVTRPDTEGKFPVILEASVYHGTLYDRTGTRIFPFAKENGKVLGLKGYFPPRGYAVVMMDLRGTGKSEGCLDHLGQNDRSDIEAVIEWAASQPWSNGKVGVTGHSYLGGSTNLAGATNAKGLATIVPSASLGKMYDHQFLAGVPWNAQYLGPIEAYESLAWSRHLPPGLPADPTGLLYTNPGDNFGNDMQDFGCGIPNAAIFDPSTSQVTGEAGPWHEERDFSQDVRNTDVPVFYIHGVNDEAARVTSMDWFTARGRDGKKNANDKLWLGQWDHGIGHGPNYREVQWTHMLHAWFDRWLGGRRVDTGPPVEVFLAEGNPPDGQARLNITRSEIFTAASWPPPAKAWELRPSADGTLTDGEAAGGTASYAADPLGYLDAEATGHVVFESGAVDRDRLLVGEPELELAVSTTMPLLHLIARVVDVDEKGVERRISQCAMQIALRDGIEDVSPAVPGTRYTIKPPCFAMAHHLRKGHKLRLRVASSDDEFLPIVWQIDPNVTVYTGQDATVLRLPEVSSRTNRSTRAGVHKDNIPMK